MEDETANSIRKASWSKWIPFFGIPTDLHSDQSHNVDGEVIRELCKWLGIDKSHSSPYHPEGNGSAERSIGSIKTMTSTMSESRKLSVHEWDTVTD